MLVPYIFSGQATKKLKTIKAMVIMVRVRGYTPHSHFRMIQRVKSEAD